MISANSSAVVNGTIIDSYDLPENSIIHNIVELGFHGAYGSGIYIGKGRILTAAHNFTLRTSDLSALDKRQVRLSTLNGHEVLLNKGQYRTKLDPTSNTYIMSSPGQFFVNFENDLAIIQLEDSKLIKELETSANFSEVDEKVFTNKKVKIGDKIKGFGLNWKNSRESMSLSNLLSGERDEDNRFSYFNGEVTEFQETTRGSSEFKIYGRPLENSSSEPGDSGGAVFRVSNNGQLELIAVHHGRKPVEGHNQISEIFALQNIDWNKVESFVSPDSQEWSKLVTYPNAAYIKAIDIDVIKSLTEHYSRLLQIYRSSNPSQAKLEFKEFLNILFQGALLEEDLNEVTKVFTMMRFDTPKAEDLKEELVSIFATKDESPKSCASTLSSLLKDIDP